MYATVVPGTDKINLNCPAGSTGTYYCSYITSGGVIMVSSGLITGLSSPLVLTPAAGETNRVLAISIYGSPTSTLSADIQYFDGTNNETLLNITLLSGYTLTYTADGAGWVVLDAMGHRY